jgi:hypothetical protein
MNNLEILTAILTPIGVIVWGYIEYLKSKK